VNTSTGAIETVYDGYRFRSQLEARWATFFNVLGVKYEYEKEGYRLRNGTLYLPDFWLPNVTLRFDLTPGIWIEIKGQGPTAEESIKCGGLYDVTLRPVILFVGLPTSWNERGNDSGYEFSERGWDNCMGFMECERGTCRHIKIEFAESNYRECPKCKARASEDTPRLIAAYTTARQARFEHNQNGY